MQAKKETFEKKCNHFETIKTVAKAYKHKRDFSLQEAVYHILLELHLGRVFPGVGFVKQNVPENRSKILQSGEELAKFPEDSTDIFK